MLFYRDEFKSFGNFLPRGYLRLYAKEGTEIALDLYVCLRSASIEWNFIGVALVTSSSAFQPQGCMVRAPD